MKKMIFSTLLTAMDAEALDEKLSAFQTFLDEFGPNLIKLAVNIGIGILILVLGNLLIKLILKLFGKFLKRTKADAGVQNFTVSLFKIVLYIVLVIVIAGILGIPTASFITLLGSAGLAIGLALQGSLSNFAGGVLILILKPFRVGDYIKADSGEGTVTSIDIFCTTLTTVDNRTVVIPNGTLSNSSVTNYSRERSRRIDLTIPVSYQSDIDEVQCVLQQIADALEEMREADRPVDIFISAFGEDAIEFAYRIWVKNENYWTVRAKVLEQVKKRFDEKGITIPFRQMNVTIEAAETQKGK